jgi:hypothetical protein
MKCLRLSLAVGVLTTVLATSTLAGDMPCPVAPPAPPSAAGEMPLPGVASTDIVAEVALNLMQIVLSLY